MAVPYPEPEFLSPLEGEVVMVWEPTLPPPVVVTVAKALLAPFPMKYTFAVELALYPAPPVPVRQ